MCQPRGARRLATSVPSPLPIIAQGTGACQLGSDHAILDHDFSGRIRKLPIVNRKRQGTLDRVCNRQGVSHMGVNRSHEHTAADRSLVAVLVNESVNVPRLLCVSDQALDVRCVTVSTDKLRGLGTLGTDQATEDDHFFLVCATG